MPSAIEWTDETWNPVTGCSRVSPGCDNCYMFALYPRLRAMAVPGYESAPDQRATPMWERLGCPADLGGGPGVYLSIACPTCSTRTYRLSSYTRFFASWSRPSRERGHVFQVLTKRPGTRRCLVESNTSLRFPDGWPPNVWIGTSVESQKYAHRLTVLSRIPAAVRFVSAEPLLEAVDLTRWLESGALHWVIVGGESGPHARPMELEWARDLRDQSIRTGVAFFLKQLGGVRNKRGGTRAVLDQQQWLQMPAAV